MKAKQAAGSQPTAGTRHARIFTSIHSAENNMTSKANANTPNHVDFALLSECARKMANGLGMEVVSFPDGFAAVKDGDVISGECTSDELECWLNGYESGMDDIEIVTRLDDGRLVLAELIRAEQVIQVLCAQMTDAQKDAAGGSLAACGLSTLGSSMCQQRRETIAAARLIIGKAV